MATLIRTTQESPAARGSRLLFIDNLRWVMIALVICHHAAVTYSHVGGWYYMDGPKPPLFTSLLLTTFETLNQSYFMGLLFLVAGYFVPRAFDTKGAGKFLRDRAVRLGIPTLFFMLVIYPFTVYWLLRNFDDPSIPPLSEAYGRYITSGQFLASSGPMWFALALLIFCVVYAAVRLIGGSGYGRALALPGNKEVIGLMLVMGSCTFLMRITQPIGVNIWNMQLCYFSQYILLFVVGLVAYRSDWLMRIPEAFGVFWLRVALVVGVLGWPALIVVSGVLKGDARNLLGGWHWQSALFSFWEAIFCVGVCLGLVVWFRERFNGQGRFARWMSANSFSAYLFHPPILVAITLGLKQVAALPLVRFGLACALAVPITFLVSGVVRERVPGLRQLL